MLNNEFHSLGYFLRGFTNSRKVDRHWYLFTRSWTMSQWSYKYVRLSVRGIFAFTYNLLSMTATFDTFLDICALSLIYSGFETVKSTIQLWMYYPKWKDKHVIYLIEICRQDQLPFPICLIPEYNRQESEKIQAGKAELEPWIAWKYYDCRYYKIQIVF